jgi:CTP synthase (UTP-ammonia lyase)
VFRYGNASFVDERHRHRYEVTVSHGQTCGSTLHEEKKVQYVLLLYMSDP